MSDELKSGNVRIKYGTYNNEFPLQVGKTIGEVMRNLKQPYGIPDSPLVITIQSGGSPVRTVSESYVLKAGDTVELIKPHGEKAGPNDPASQQYVDGLLALQLPNLVDRAVSAYAAVLLPDMIKKALNLPEGLGYNQEMSDLHHRLAALEQGKGNLPSAHGGAFSALEQRLSDLEKRLRRTAWSEIAALQDRFATLKNIDGMVESISRRLTELEIAASNAPSDLLVKSLDKRIDEVASIVTMSHATAIHELRSAVAQLNRSEQARNGPACNTATPNSQKEGEKVATMQVSLDGGKVFRNILLAALISLAGWVGFRTYNSYEFDSGFTTYWERAVSCAGTDQAKASRYADQAVAYLEKKGMTSGRTDAVLDAGPDADVGDWYTDIKAVSDRLRNRKAGPLTDKEQDEMNRISVPAPPSGVFTGISIHPWNKHYTYWLLGTIAAAILGGFGATWNKMRG